MAVTYSDFLYNTVQEHIAYINWDEILLTGIPLNLRKIFNFEFPWQQRHIFTCLWNAVKGHVHCAIYYHHHIDFSRRTGVIIDVMFFFYCNIPSGCHYFSANSTLEWSRKTYRNGILAFEFTLHLDFSVCHQLLKGRCSHSITYLTEEFKIRPWQREQSAVLNFPIIQPYSFSLIFSNFF